MRYLSPLATRFPGTGPCMLTIAGSASRTRLLSTATRLRTGATPGFTWTVGQKVSLRLTAVVDGESVGVSERGGGREDADGDFHREPGHGLGAFARGLPRHREQRPAQRRLGRRRHLRQDGEADPGFGGEPHRHGQGALHQAVRQAAAGRLRQGRGYLRRPGGDQQHPGYHLVGHADGEGPGGQRFRLGLRFCECE